VAWQEEVLDAVDNGRTLKVPRPQLQGIASLWGQDHQPPKERDKKLENISAPCLCPLHCHRTQPLYLSPEQVQMVTQEPTWPHTPPW
jgi:hypothetical protein